MTVIIIPESFALAHKEHKNGPCQFGYSVLKDGRYFCDPNSKIEFPEIFEGTNFDQVEITDNDLIRE